MLFVERKRKWEGVGLGGIRSAHRVGMRKTQQRAERPLPRRGGNNASRECIPPRTTVTQEALVTMRGGAATRRGTAQVQTANPGNEKPSGAENSICRF